MALIKPLSTLSAEDLAMFALWEYAMDVEDAFDETAVRPVDSAVVPVDRDDTVYHVACDVALANGRVLTGHVAVCNGEVELDLPTIVDDAGTAYALEQPPGRREREAFERLFGTPFEGVFPLRWQLRLPLDGEAAYRVGEATLDAEPGPEPGTRLH
jgi:hypothetical protein